MTARVLLVEDVDEVRRLLRVLVRRQAGLEVVGEASTAAQALRLAAENQPDVVLLDLGLPDLAGRELFARVRDAAPRARIVVFTGTEPDDNGFWAEHTAGYVLKGAEPDYLVRVLQDAADQGPPPGGPGEDGAAYAAASFPDVLESVPAARTFALEHIARWDLGRHEHDVALIVTELAANAVTHAASPFEVRLRSGGAQLRVEVRDESPRTPEPQPFSETRESGRGMLLVSALSTAWGIEPIPGAGKVTWAEIGTVGDPDAS
ncbi:response regulator [Nocardioides sp. SYSU DS0663]|uniref:response regulator n=1 Tax=Nocardioides sp. SYSU DS0663 TaxID=3416445 RepID=UPI003F4CA9C0